MFLGDDLGAGVLSSGFPVMSDPLESLKYPECMRSGWNLNNMLTQSGSLLSFESSEVTSKFAPCVRVGMCFSSSSWVSYCSFISYYLQAFVLPEPVLGFS